MKGVQAVLYLVRLAAGSAAGISAFIGPGQSVSLSCVHW